jgi:WD40 repeat protein
VAPLASRSAQTGRTLTVVGANGDIYLWAVNNGRINTTLADPDTRGTTSEAFSSNGKIVAVADGNRHIYL